MITTVALLPRPAASRRLKGRAIIARSNSVPVTPDASVLDR
jgi:hypothetical protein